MQQFSAHTKKEGSHFRIFLGEQWVVKQRKSVEEIARTLKYRKPLWRPSKMVKRARMKKEERDRSIEAIKSARIDKRFFGDLTFVEKVGISYKEERIIATDAAIQERFYTIPVAVRWMLRSGQREEAKELVEDFVNYHRELWMRKLFEESFDLATNYGLNREGNVRAIGISRFTDNRDEALEHATNRSFLDKEAVRPLQIRPALRQIRSRYVEQCLQELNPSTFNDLWPSAD
jgi:hypothetical protein